MKIAVVLGNRLLDDAAPTRALKERIGLAIDFYERHSPDFVILSGGMANPKAGVSEAEAMKKMLDGLIPEDKLITESESLTTRQNALYSVPVALKLNATEITVISSPEHIDRRYLNPIRLFRKTLKKHGARHIPVYAYKKCGE